MKDRTREEPRILAAAERQMQAWAKSQEIADRSLRLDQSERLTQRLGPYITISREAGACGSEIAELVGEDLGWEVLDKGLLDCVANRFRLSRPMLELVDETTSNWAFDIFGTWLDRQVIPHEKYIAHLGRVALAAARRGNVIFVGRGVQFLLPREAGLAVRIIASEKYRVNQIVRRRGLGEAAARRYIRDLDRGRREFVSRYFHHDIDDPHVYDLVLNAEGLGPVGTVEQILAAIRK